MRSIRAKICIRPFEALIMTINHNPAGALRSSSVPILKADLPRRSSFECPQPRSRRQSLDIKAFPKAKEAQTTDLGFVSRDGVRLEVGQAVDISEQIRRLEANWNSEDVGTSFPEEAVIFVLFATGILLLVFLVFEFYSLASSEAYNAMREH